METNIIEIGALIYLMAANARSSTGFARILSGAWAAALAIVWISLAIGKYFP